MFGHAAAATARTEASALARERHETLERAVCTPEPREAMGQDPAREELAEFLLDEARQAVSVAPVGGLPQEGLQMFADDGVEDRVLGVARLIRAMGDAARAWRSAYGESRANAKRWIRRANTRVQPPCRSSTTVPFPAAGRFVPRGPLGLCGLRVLVASHVSGCDEAEAIEKYRQNSVVAEPRFESPGHGSIAQEELELQERSLPQSKVGLRFEPATDRKSRASSVPVTIWFPSRSPAVRVLSVFLAVTHMETFRME
jgi:hypothetical protein